MLFNSLHFLIFLPIVWILFQYAGRYKFFILLLASFYFYMAWNYYFILLILFSIFIDYFAALSISKLDKSNPKRKLYLFLSLIVNLGFLGFFKYTNFFLGIWNDLNISGFKFPLYDIILPVGISFYTFQSMSYTIDVYRGIEPVRKSILDFALYVSFFPQLVAGPIVRAHTFFRDLENLLPVDREVFRHSFSQILLGFTKKVVFADNLAITVDAVFNNPSISGSLEIWIAVYAFMWQIYFDFSGYTDIAIGVARLFGFQFDANFYFPFNVSSISEHWSRWHLSFTTWIRDYIYIPLGGSRGSDWMISRNIFITFLFGGIWHGASYHFVVWGVYHSFMLIVERFYAKTKLREWFNQKGGLPYMIFCRIFTLFSLGLGLPLFRANTMEDASLLLGKMFQFGNFSSEPIRNFNYFKLIVLLFITAQIFEKYKIKQMLKSKLSFTIFILVNFFLLLCYGVGEAKNFIYFAF
ncbi:MAG: MBOAT family protein [Leptospiraceae bacterium]|nr:MBOAT family protein [Leptospiraceae bacterium]